MRLVICLWILFCAFHVQAQQDSVRMLREVQVRSVPMPEIKPASVPFQKFDQLSLSRMQAVQLSDAIKHFSGIQVKDYGGIGGLKTVSVRGLGSNHTAFGYDGVTVNDVQSGQIDLGKFSLNNITEVSLAIGSPEELLAPARTFASGSIVNVKTTVPSFGEDELVHANINLKVGSFGLFAPAVNIQNKLSKKFSNSFLAEWQYAGGQYPYTLDYGGLKSKEERRNTDISAWHLEENMFFRSDSHNAFTKFYYYQSERGLPGATIFYNPHSSQRLWDRNLFVHSQLESRISKSFKTLFNLKATSVYLRYLDPDYLGTAGKLENIYRQTECYISAATVYTGPKKIEVGFSTDWFYNLMDANLYQFAYPSRYTWLTSLQVKYKTNYVDVQAGALSTVVHEQTKSGSAANDYARVSPSFIAGFRPLGHEDLVFRFFYKDIFRMPTFNDLYYSGVGNKSLQPEKTKQFNAGIVYTRAFAERSVYVSGSVDAYHNRVTDKIVAIPTKNLFIWSMMNVGTVQINGIDMVLKSGIEVLQSISVNLESSYTFHHVLDKTDPESKTYSDQLAYTPVHSGSLTFSVINPWVNLYYNLLFSGSRYTLNHNTYSNHMPGYTEQGITLSKRIHVKTMESLISLEVLNILDQQYEVVRNFPLAGRSYRATLSIKF